MDQFFVLLLITAGVAAGILTNGYINDLKEENKDKEENK
jgi:hypothetical protein